MKFELKTLNQRLENLHCSPFHSPAPWMVLGLAPLHFVYDSTYEPRLSAAISVDSTKPFQSKHRKLFHSIEEKIKK